MDKPNGAFLVFVIDAGAIQWNATFNTLQEAVDYINALRPDGTSSIDDVAVNEAFTVKDCIEFAFIVESPHFVSFV